MLQETRDKPAFASQLHAAFSYWTTTEGSLNMESPSNDSEQESRDWPCCPSRPPPHRPPRPRTPAEAKTHSSVWKLHLECQRNNKSSIQKWSTAFAFVIFQCSCVRWRGIRVSFHKEKAQITYVFVLVLHEISNNVNNKQVLEEDDEQSDWKHVQLEVPHDDQEHLSTAATSNEARAVATRRVQNQQVGKIACLAWVSFHQVLHCTMRGQICNTHSKCSDTARFWLPVEAALDESSRLHSSLSDFRDPVNVAFHHLCDVNNTGGRKICPSFHTHFCHSFKTNLYFSQNAAENMQIRTYRYFELGLWLHVLFLSRVEGSDCSFELQRKYQVFGLRSNGWSLPKLHQLVNERLKQAVLRLSFKFLLCIKSMRICEQDKTTNSNHIQAVTISETKETCIPDKRFNLDLVFLGNESITTSLQTCVSTTQRYRNPFLTDVLF